MLTLNEIAHAITTAADRIEELENENKNLWDRLINAQSEALAAAKKAEPKPAPQCIGKENVISFVTTKSAELQVSPGVVWGMVLDALKKSDAFGKTEHRYIVGDKARNIKSGEIVMITKIMYNTKLDSYYYEVELHGRKHTFQAHEIEPAASINACDQIFETAASIDKPKPTAKKYRIGDKVRLPNGDEVKIYDIKTFSVGGEPIYLFRQKHDVYFGDQLKPA